MASSAKGMYAFILEYVVLGGCLSPLPFSLPIRNFFRGRVDDNERNSVIWW